MRERERGAERRGRRGCRKGTRWIEGFRTRDGTGGWQWRFIIWQSIVIPAGWDFARAMSTEALLYLDICMCVCKIQRERERERVAKCNTLYLKIVAFVEKSETLDSCIFFRVQRDRISFLPLDSSQNEIRYFFCYRDSPRIKLFKI